jgi:tetratricopeptide (TPR) repeat protein
MLSKYLAEAEEHIKNAMEQKQNAADAEKTGKIKDAANYYYTAGREYFLAASKFKIVLTLLGYSPKSSIADDKSLNYKSRLIDSLEESCSCYEKAAQLFKGLGNRFLESEAYGQAASNYIELAELKNEKAVRREAREGIIVKYVADTPLGKAITVYHNAALALYDLGMKYRNSGEIDKAYVFIGEMGDAYLNIGLLYENEDIDLAIENFFSAAEAYKESGLLSRKVGIPTIVHHARLEWRYATRNAIEFFKDERGYYTADDIRRAIKTYEKTKELAKKANNVKMVYECSKAVMLLSADVKEPKDSIKSCQEICEILSEFVILPIDLSNKQLDANDKEVIRTSLKEYSDDPKQGAYQLISHVESRLRSYIKAKLSSINPTNWFKELVIPTLNSDDLRVITSNYSRERGRNPDNLSNEENPLSFANINHLQKIISDDRLWESYFKSDFVNFEEFSANMSIIVRIRHSTMHVRETNIFEAAVTPALWILERLKIGEKMRVYR